MKQVVVFDGLSELAVRPRELFDRYISLLRTDIDRTLSNTSRFSVSKCPGCRSEKSEPVFEKLSFSYRICHECGSVYVSPRPTSSDISNFTKNSEAVKFWFLKVETETANSRSHSIFLPRAVWVTERARKQTLKNKILVDINSKYPAFIDAMLRSKIFSKVISVAPVWSNVLDINTEVIVSADGWSGKIERGASIVSIQECVERAPDPDYLLQEAANALIDNGLLFLTSITWSGFDLQVLQGNSKQILPPSHLNLFTIDGIKRLLARHGFKVIELSTPGQLDVEIVRHAVEDDPAIKLPPFIDELIRHRDEATHHAFQSFLQESLLSSHLRIVAQKIAKEGMP